MIRAIAWLAATVVAGPALAAGSGTVNFEFQQYRGPIAAGPVPNDPATWFLGGQVAGIDMVTASLLGNPAVTFTGGRQIDPNVVNGTRWYTANVALAGNSVDFVYRGFDGTALYPTLLNSISFAPSSFSGVNVGDPFKLGTLSFRNGGWFGGAPDDPANNLPTVFRFRITTTSADGPQYNQISYGTIVMTVNATVNNDLTTLAGQQAEADWVNVYQTDSSFSTVLADLGSLRVYDLAAAPSGFTNIGSIDLNGLFGSLHLSSLSNAQGGFFEEGSGALPNVPLGGPGGAIPEPASWAMLIAGFGLLGAMQRRRKPGFAA
ncbi:MAG: PEP-CTERM sorting domain-containing protein [Alphaproteobacteria bacterium]|nr:PEP-CTERM sorting domain-containing protein [Alphaproteobacteria bacterium]